ncbi:Hypothetical predicted protein [Mytilus galloprovincialis]|uniref:Zinc finger PHD-type domain-containing protein n=1 Tax=Mytilus galloprovincialis TaxID=29158 RepID=A0A8B6HS58_MYTGA|nr:Hypothetical predicted protein [Mytilus galloprovincialis]
MRVLSGQEKYRRALDLGQKITAVIAEKLFKDHTHHIKNLEILLDLLQQTKPYAITCTEVFVDEIEGATLQQNQDIIITSNVNTDELNQETAQEHIDEARPHLIEDIAILSWILKYKNSTLDDIISEKTQADVNNLLDVSLKNNKIFDEHVNLQCIKKYFTNEAWNQLKIKITEKNLHDQDSLACDCCLDWQHLKCAGLKSVQKQSYWICKICSKS